VRFEGRYRSEKARALDDLHRCRAEERDANHEKHRAEQEARERARVDAKRLDEESRGEHVYPVPARGALREEATAELDFETLTLGEVDEPTATPHRGLTYPTEADRIAAHNARDARGGTLTEAEWVRLVEAFEHRCAYCGCSPRSHYLVLEHVRPISLGGRTDSDNVLPACWRCNVDKGSKPLDEWAATRHRPLARVPGSSGRRSAIF
jgi:5-methylcytosine-specific restriction endonuclease McrA